ncbi:MAG: polysaccharide pyruvyl transferase family protein [Thiobacillus sp.]
MRQILIDRAILVRNHFHVTRPLRRLGRSNRQRDALSPCRFLIIPADAADPAGSLGDMAMLTALMQSLRARDAASAFTVIGTRDHAIAVPGIGDVPVVAAWVGKAGTLAFDRLIHEHDALFVMGADVLDGKYGAALVARAVGYCNHSARLGVPAATLGFSFNRRPRYPAVYALSRLDPAVQVNVRDEPSLRRFLDTVKRPARLCADTAFLMAPSTQGDAEAEAWIVAARRAGRTPVGVNLNAHALAPAIEKAGLAALVDHLAQQLGRAAEKRRLAYLLIPHDLRPQSGDVAILRMLAQTLRRDGFMHEHYAAMARPDVIKRVVGQLDLVVTGRMHLAIAALGSGTPVMCVTYQDKFEGLYQHFGLALDHTVAPLQCLDEAFLARLEFACEQIPVNRERIHAKLPDVTALALRNLDAIAP